VATPFSTDARFLTAGITIVYFYDLETGKATQVDLDSENGLGMTCKRFPPALSLCWPGKSRRAGFLREEWRRWKRRQLAGDHVKNMESFFLSDDGKTIVYASSTASKMPQLYRAQLDSGKITSPVQLTKLNEGLVNGRTYAKTEVIHWKGANDESVEGIL